MRRLALALALVGCTAKRPPLAAVDGQASVLELAFTVQVAEAQCTMNAKHLNRFDAKRSEALFDACTKALIPARDAVFFVSPGVWPWTQASAAAVGCAGKAVRVALESVQGAFVQYGYTAAISPGYRNAARLEQWAEETCDPLHPTSQTTVFVDPKIANVEPEYP